MIPVILQRCACLSLQRKVSGQIAHEAGNIRDWQGVLRAAETHGMSPLLASHLEESRARIPLDVKCSLHLLRRRHLRQNTILLSELGKIAALFSGENIRFLILKGAALANTIYQDPGLRPMRDLDILVDPEQVYAARALLLQNGYAQDPGYLDNPAHHHLAPITKQSEGCSVYVELHRRLFTHDNTDLEFADFQTLYSRAMPCSVVSNPCFSVKTLGLTDMLYHVFTHALHPRLWGSGEGFRLINITDITGFVTQNYETLDWQGIKNRWPAVYQALPYIGYLTPWPEQVQNRFPRTINRPPKKIGEPYTGWPGRPAVLLRNKNILSVLRKTFFPSEWWLWIYYAPKTKMEAVYNHLVVHPMNVIRWTCTITIWALRSCQPESTGKSLIKRCNALFCSFVFLIKKIKA